MKPLSAYGTLAFRMVGMAASLWLPPRAARVVLDCGAALLFGKAERAEFVDTRGERVTL